MVTTGATHSNIHPALNSNDIHSIDLVSGEQTEEKPGLLNLFWEWLIEWYQYHFTKQPFQMPVGRAQNVKPVHGHYIYSFNRVDKNWERLATVDMEVLKKMKHDPFTYYFTAKNDRRAKKYLKKLFNGKFDV